MLDREADGYADHELLLTPAPASWAAWIADVRAHLPVLWTLARKDFRTRYKRAALGMVWAVVVPLVQATVLAVVFSRIVSFDTGTGYAAFVMSGIFAWSYFGGSLPVATTAVVDGAGLADKVWFPRCILVLSPLLANLVGLAISLVILLALTPVLGGQLGRNCLWMLPGAVLLVAFTTGASLVLSALHVYFRDTKFLVSASMLVWLYATPVLYPASSVGRLGPWLDLNPMTGVVSLFHAAVLDEGLDERAILVSVVASVVVLGLGLRWHRERDRLFVDRL